jgi:DNA (cytosine-5)-methyltransferase 1
MIQAVPPGGNWRNIPLSVPSKRLDQIRISGGRTTLYGRLRWDAPSYTVTTYFNRPGNGCYIHPSSDRVLTSLEAARLQSFPDSFKFFGSKTSRTKQIGNAVPPLLAFAIGRQIKQIHPDIESTMDLFCGAGGLSLGLKWAGFKTLAANDFFREAGETFAMNNPETHFVLGDITNRDIQDELVQVAEGKGGADLIVGGPPCQGFSNAGLRMIDDPRNALYKNFVSLVARCNPKLFVMENVEGIMSINGGKTYAAIEEDFRALGYEVEGRKLLAVNYGVPQKRKRVIIIGSRIGDPKDLFPPNLVQQPHFMTVQDAIGDIPFDTSSSVDDSITPKPAASGYQRLMQGEITAMEFCDSLQTR